MAIPHPDQNSLPSMTFTRGATGTLTVWRTSAKVYFGWVCKSYRSGRSIWLPFRWMVDLWWKWSR